MILSRIYQYNKLVILLSLILHEFVDCEVTGLGSICKRLQNSNKASICQKEVGFTIPLSPLYQTAQDSMLDEVFFYPSSFLIRPRHQEDMTYNMSSHSCSTGDNEMTIVRVSDTAKLEKENQNLIISQLSDQVVDENIDPNKKNRLNVRRRKEMVKLDMITTGAKKFHKCCLESLNKNEKLYRNNTLAWRESDEAKICKQIAQLSFDEVNNELENMSLTRRQQEEKNRILRSLATVWGSDPSILAHLLLLFGCSDFDSYDEFFGCVFHINGLTLNLNVHQRNLNEYNLAGEPWRCTTCFIHQHPRWFASYVVTGQLAYTMTRPECPKASDLSSPLPSVEELEESYPITGFSLVDKPGTRYYISDDQKDVVWETTEVIQLKQGHSLVFSPLWYHRVVPPAENATHAAITLLARFEKDKSIGTGYGNYNLEIPNEIEADHMEKPVCFNLMDLYNALTNPAFDVKRGLELFHCTKENIHPLNDAAKDFNMFLEPNTILETATGKIEEEEEEEL